MKKFSLLAFLFLFPALCLAGNPSKQVVNNYDWSARVTSSNDVAWQIFNSSTNTNARTIYITDIDVASDKGGWFVVYSTNVGNGFSGVTVAGSAVPSRVSADYVAISSVTTCSNATSLTGDVLWNDIVQASETAKILLPGMVWAVDPGSALYVVKENGAAGEKASVSFRFVESPR